MFYLQTTKAFQFFIIHISISVTTQAITPKIKTDKNGIYILDNSNIEDGIKLLDSVVVAFYSPKCRSCLEAESELGV